MPKLNPTHIFVDFDETLFDHMSYIAWLETELEKLGKLPKGKGSFKDTVNNYHDVVSEVPLLRLYHHAEHMQDISNESWELISGEIEKLVKSQDKDFCYDDAHDFLGWLSKQSYDTRILTYGDGEYQRFKIMTCKYLRNHHLPVHVTTQPKRLFLQKHFSKVNGVLIDDKYPLDLPSNWQHIWVDRSAKLAVPKHLPEGVIKISSLQKVKRVLK